MLGSIFSGKEIERLRNNLKHLNIYFHDETQKQVENDIDTFLFTVEKEKIEVDNNINVVFHEPIIFENNLYEVFPNMNITKLPREEYLMQLYFYLVKVMARKKSKRTNLDKKRNHFYEEFLYGISSKKIVVEGNNIKRIISKEHELLDFLFNITIAQILYENIENKPYTSFVDLKVEMELKKFKFYLSQAYYSPINFIKDYLNCDIKKITNQIVKKTNFNSLIEFENELQ